MKNEMGILARGEVEVAVWLSGTQCFFHEVAASVVGGGMTATGKGLGRQR
jgi:hypothetical protein